MGQKDELSALLLERKSSLMRYINSLIGNILRRSLDAEEVLSEALRYLLEHPEHLENRNARELYLFLLWKSKMIVRDRAKQLRRSNQRTEKLVNTIDLCGEGGSQTVPSPTLQIHREDKRVSLKRCIDMIPSADQRKALSLVRLQGYSFIEVGLLMNKTPDAVKQLVRRGFESLVQILRRHGGWKYETTGVTS